MPGNAGTAALRKASPGTASTTALAPSGGWGAGDLSVRGLACEDARDAPPVHFGDHVSATQHAGLPGRPHQHPSQQPWQARVRAQGRPRRLRSMACLVSAASGGDRDDLQHGRVLRRSGAMARQSLQRHAQRRAGQGTTFITASLMPSILQNGVRDAACPVSTG